MKKDNNKTMKKISLVVFFLLLAGAVIVIVYLLTNRSETYTSRDKQNEASEYIHCTAINPSDQFFKLRAEPLKTNHEIKVMFRGDDLDKIFYAFHGEYGSDNGAVVTEFDITDQYNKYVAGVGLAQNVLSPKISTSGSNADASFYVESSKLKPVLAPIFFLDKDEYAGVSGDLKGYLLRNYEGKGFTCEKS